MLALQMIMPNVAAAAQPGSVYPEEWAAYENHFVTPEGRVVDTANGGISHSEGQGYGMLLAVLANDRLGFDQIWSFTQQELMVRDDGLLAWKWDPAAVPHITDENNASDGDLLVAYALALGGQTWNAPELLDAARDLANALGRAASTRWRGRDILLPAAFGFRREDQDDGPVVNLSYWVFEAFPLLARVAPETDWESIAMNGRRLVNEARFGASGLPTDWISLRHGAPAPAAEFPPEFGYNAIRIPLYLLRAGTREPALLSHFVWPLADENTAATVQVETGHAVDRLAEPGYRLIGEAVNCVLSQSPVDPSLQEFTPTSYYGSTLQLLALAYLRANASHCLRGQP